VTAAVAVLATTPLDAVNVSVLELFGAFAGTVST
jgi:hypothetical protein